MRIFICIQCIHVHIILLCMLFLSNSVKVQPFVFIFLLFFSLSKNAAETLSSCFLAAFGFCPYYFNLVRDYNLE